MPTFLWSGKTASGQKIADRITSNTAAEARQILEQRGWTDLRQHTTEIHDFAKQQVREASSPKRRPNLTPEEELAVHEGTTPNFWRRWLKSLLIEIPVILIVTFYLTTAAYNLNIFGIIISSAALLALLLLFPASYLWFRQTKYLFRKLHAARTWHRWNDVLRYLDKIQKAQRFTNIGIGETSVARYRALALAGLGKVDEGVSIFREAAEKANMPKWLFHSLLASIYSVAKQYERGLNLYRQAVEEATNKSTACIGMGEYLVIRFNRPNEARQLLMQAEASQLSELARVHLYRLRGIIAFREKDFETVDKQMREALAGFEKHAKPRPHIYEPSILLCKGYLSVSSAALGKKKGSKKLFCSIRKISFYQWP